MKRSGEGHLNAPGTRLYSSAQSILLIGLHPIVDQIEDDHTSNQQS
jgi:hypothetical protein